MAGPGPPPHRVRAAQQARVSGRAPMATTSAALPPDTHPSKKAAEAVGDALGSAQALRCLPEPMGRPTGGPYSQTPGDLVRPPRGAREPKNEGRSSYDPSM